jgi:DNA-binding NarL/FixJ family response regulator
VLLIDDEFLVRCAWEDLLHAQPDIKLVGTANRADQLDSLVDSLHPDIVVIDISMPGKSAFEAIGDLQNTHPEIRAIVHSAYSAHDKAQAAFDAGAWGFIDKLMEPAQVRDVLRRVSAGKVYFPEEAVRQ